MVTGTGCVARDAVGEATITGNSGVPASLDHAPDRWSGFRDLAFIWEESVVLDLPAGRSDLIIHPCEIACSVFFADLAAVRLTPS